MTTYIRGLSKEVFLHFVSGSRFKSDPVFAVGDIKIRKFNQALNSGAGGYEYANTSNLPVVDVAGSSMARLVLTADECDQDNISLQCISGTFDWDEFYFNLDADKSNVVRAVDEVISVGDLEFKVAVGKPLTSRTTLVVGDTYSEATENQIIISGSGLPDLTNVVRAELSIYNKSNRTEVVNAKESDSIDVVGKIIRFSLTSEETTQPHGMNYHWTVQLTYVGDLKRTVQRGNLVFVCGTI